MASLEQQLTVWQKNKQEAEVKMLTAQADLSLSNKEQQHLRGELTRLEAKVFELRAN